MGFFTRVKRRQTRVRCSKQDICNRSTTGLARITGPQNSLDSRVILCESYIHRPTRHYDQNRWALGGRCYFGHKVLLVTRKKQASPVHSFSLNGLIQAHHQHSCIRLLGCIYSSPELLVVSASHICTTRLVNSLGIFSYSLQRAGVSTSNT